MVVYQVMFLALIENSTWLPLGQYLVELIG
jgi:hypothetical protein